MVTSPIISEIIKDLLYQATSVIANNSELNIDKKEILLEHPKELHHGDYSSNIALKLAKKIHKNPLEIAEDIKETIQSNLDTESKNTTRVEKIEVVKPGFINFFVDTNYLLNELVTISKEKMEYGKAAKNSKKIIVEFAHPNTHKIFHIGHLRNISIGESISRVLEARGYEVVRVNYQGDVGLHIAKCLWSLKKYLLDSNKTIKELEGLTIQEQIALLGQHYAQGNAAYEDQQIAKEEIHEINQMIYTKDREIFELWSATRKWSLDYFDMIYKKVGTKYDHLFFESNVQEAGIKVAKDALAKEILKNSEGAVVFDGREFGLDTRVFINSLGLPTYEAKELGLAKEEFTKFGIIDRCIHVVGPEQKSFFEVTFKVEELLDKELYQNKQYHLVYAHVVLKEGKMSSRKGSVITGISLLEEAEQKALSKVQTIEGAPQEDRTIIAEKVGIAAVKYGMLKYSPNTQIKFDMEEAVSFEGNSGPYLQYTYVRAKSILRKNIVAIQDSSIDQKATLNKEELDLLRMLSRFSEVVEETVETFSPNSMCNYLFDVAQKFNSFYNNYPIIKAEEMSKSFRLLLTVAVSEILKQGLYLLGIETPEKM